MLGGVAPQICSLRGVMKIKFLGTAAYEGVPSPFCKCRVCEQSKRLGGRNVRSRAQALVNDDLLLDFNADTVGHYQRYAFDWQKITDCLITHSHCDHLYADDVGIAAADFTHEHTPMRFYAAEDGYGRLREFTDLPASGASATLVLPYARFTAGDGRYTVLPLPANHDKRSSPVFYSITERSSGKRLLYAHDTGVFEDGVWNALREEGRFDLISLDCTGCLGLNGVWREGHMSLGSDLEIAERMRRDGLIDEKTLIVLNHFSHNGGQTYDETAEVAEKQGVIVSYDGLELEF